MVYLCLFGTGKLLLHQSALGLTLLALSAVAAIALHRTFVTSFSQEPDATLNAAAAVEGGPGAPGSRPEVGR
jgi:membrane protein implicated in regulation of membrane protease activity